MQTPPPTSPPGKPSFQLPPVRTIELLQPMHWLVYAWSDMARCGWVSFAHGVVLALCGFVILGVAHHRFWLLAGALSGFLVVAPILATGLYALSRALERGEKADAQLIIRTWLSWQKGPHNQRHQDYWCLVQFGALLALAGTGWMLVSAALITLLAPVPITMPAEFVRHVVLAKEGYLFELWLTLGGALAAPIFASTVVAIPLLLDRQVTLMQAVLISWHTVLANPLPMAFWAAVIMGFMLLGLGSLFLGLIAIVPMLGHASWHAYRDLVDVSELAPRDAI